MLQPNNRLMINRRSFLCIDGIPLVKVDPETGRMSVKDKNRRRASERGTDIVYFTVDEVVDIISKHIEEASE